MENSLQAFNYNNSEIRVIENNGEPWFVAKDVCEVLELADVTSAIKSLDDDEKMTLQNPRSHSGQRGGAQYLNVINESGLYALAFRSNKPEAKTFSKWVRAEVLPTLRKTGSYSMTGLNPINIRAAEALRDIAQSIDDKNDKAIILREAFKLITGHELPQNQKKTKTKKEPRPKQWIGEGIMLEKCSLCDADAFPAAKEMNGTFYLRCPYCGTDAWGDTLQEAVELWNSIQERNYATRL